MLMIVASSSRAPRPAELTLPKRLRAAEEHVVRSLPELPQTAAVDVEIDALRLDHQRAVGDLAFVGRRAPPAQVLPLVAVPGGDAHDLPHLEIVLAQLDLDLGDELGLASDGVQHLG